MIKNRKHYFVNIVTLFLIFFYTDSSLASEKANFLSLKNDEVNVRQGPSFEHPIKFIYKKKYLPLEIIDKFETWRKIKDFQNNSGWIHISQLSKKKAAIVIDDELIMFSNSTVYSNPIALLKKGRLVKIKKCSNDWCKAITGDFKGWLKKESLWGLL